MPWHHLPAALLTGVALAQIALVHSADLSPWLGGGFGMFATIESRSERHLVATMETPGLRRPVRIPPELAERERRVRVLPTRERMTRLAEALLAWEEQRLGMRGDLTLELWRTRRDPETLAPREFLAREVRAPR